MNNQVEQMAQEVNDQMHGAKSVIPSGEACIKCKGGTWIMMIGTRVFEGCYKCGYTEEQGEGQI